jgi:hypothetical protein
MNLLERRRELMSAKSEPYLYEGFVWGRVYNSAVRTYNISVKDTTSAHGKTYYKSEYLTPYLPIVQGHTYKWRFDPQGRYPKDIQNSDWAEACGIIFNSSYGYVNVLNERNNGDPQQTTLRSWANGAVWGRFCGVGPLDDFYVLDTTTGEYLFKGKNV